MTIFIVTRAHMDKDGNHRRVGERLDLGDEQAAPFRKRRELMLPEEWAADQAARRDRARNATYEFHHYERP